MRVAVFAATRADLFPLASVLRALADGGDAEVTLLAVGTVTDPAYGVPLDGLDLTGVAVETLTEAPDGTGFDALSAAGARISTATATALERLAPEAFVVLGDRWELLYAVPPVVLRGVPLVHLHGGEVTEGAVDDRIRHAVSKLADLHCVSTAGAADRLRRLGEPADRIVVTGAPSLDRTATVRPATDERLGELLGAPVARPFALVTYHPVTAGGPDPVSGAGAVLDAVAATVKSALVTHPGLDHGREEVLDRIAAARRDHPQLVDVAALGADYLPVLAAADVVVGNSSSGIIEAASFGVPVVDVGDRQRGREHGDNVIHAPEESSAVAAAIQAALEPAFRERARRAVNPYGDGQAAARIVEVVRRAAREGAALARKGGLA